MTELYARIVISVPGNSNVVVGDEHSSDHEFRAMRDLEATGAQWVHEYYWPGDNYYAFVKFTRNSDVAHKLIELGELTQIDGHYLHLGREIRTFFDKKYSTTIL